MSLRLAWLAGFLIVAAWLAMFVIPAFSHDAPSGWAYPIECCSNADCAELPSSRVKNVSTGYLIDGKHLVPFKDARQSPDGLFHACFPTPDNLRCFFAPPPGA